MPSTDSAQAPAHPGTRLMPPVFDISDFQAVSPRRGTVIPEAYTRQSQSLLLTRIDDLISADRRKDESMALLLHELRSPLASIQNAVAVLRLGSKDETLLLRMHELIERQVRQIALLTSSLAKMAAPLLENLQPQRVRIDLGTVLRKAAETVAAEFTQRLNQLSIDLPESSVWILGDASRLEQVFVNLLANAAKYSDVGGGVTLSMQVSDGHAEVQVRDFGIGIDAESMPHIFDLFVRADTTAVRTRPGLGIGLALVRSIVDSHHGTVSAASAGVGQGSEFTVRLKLET